jgi:hypothetical protein
MRYLGCKQKLARDCESGVVKEPSDQCSAAKEASF